MGVFITINSKEKIIKSPINFKIIKGSELSIERIAEIAYLEKSVFPEDISIPKNVLKMWFTKNPDVFWCVEDIDTGRVIGHICAIPLNDETFDNTSGEMFDDRQLLPENIRQYNEPGFYKLYLCTIAVDPEYQKTTNTYKYILNAYTKLLLELSIRGIFFTEVSSMAVTNEGMRISEFLGMSIKSYGLHNSKLYHQFLFPPRFKKISNDSVVLQEGYMKKYIECKNEIDSENNKSNLG